MILLWLSATSKEVFNKPALTTLGFRLLGGMLHTGGSYIEGEHNKVSNSRAKIRLTASINHALFASLLITGFPLQELTQERLKSLAVKGGAWSALFKESGCGITRGFEVCVKIINLSTRRRYEVKDEDNRGEGIVIIHSAREHRD